MEIKKNHFGTTSKGEEVTLYILKNSNGIYCIADGYTDIYFFNKYDTFDV
jgi:hypothetical protein